jgi:hypothetical protein
MLPGILRASEFRGLRLPVPSVELSTETIDDQTMRAAVSSATYAHAVHFVLPEGAVPEDDYFDLLPGERRSIVIRGIDPLHATEIGATAVAVRTRGTV